MIKINGGIVTINKFPDGTPRVNIDINNIEEDSYDGSPCIWIEWIYESNDEIFYLMLVKKHLERFLLMWIIICLFHIFLMHEWIE